MGTYFLYGLTVESVLPLPELVPGRTTDCPPVIIRAGHVADHLDVVTSRGVFYEMNDHQFRLAVEGVARYLVSDGQEIVVEAEENADDASVRLFLLDSALGALLHQRGMLPLHGSSIETPRGAVVFVGYSGAGKSTTAAAFLRRGYCLLSDDISVIYSDGTGTPMISPGYPQIKLWAEALTKLEALRDTLNRVRPQLEKYALPVEHEFRAEPLPIHAIYLLQPNNTGELSITSLHGLQKVLLLMNHIYRPRFMEGMHKVAVHLNTSLIFAQKIRMCQVSRPIEGFLLDELVERLESDFIA